MGLALQRLTRPFEQVRDDAMLAKTGMGLGLVLVRALVEQHGGSFKIDSPAQKGTVATVEFSIFAATLRRGVGPFRHYLFGNFRAVRRPLAHGQSAGRDHT